MIKHIGLFIFGAGSSLVYAAAGWYFLISDYTQTMDPVALNRLLVGVAFSYIFLQGLQVVLMGLQRVSGGVLDILLSILPVVPLILAFPLSGADEIFNWVYYAIPVLIDLVIFMTISLKLLKLTSEAVIVR
tara:strand:- start:1021 stop:1413 length:393 start_codon:yes stop_codon:yes gene_type:complete